MKIASGILILFLTLSLKAATINIACDFLAISNALCVTAQEGDTVNIAAGSCTITNTIQVDRNISFTVKGSGSNSTVLISGSVGQALWFLSDSANVMSISDMSFGSNPNNSGAFLICGWTGRSNPGPYHIYNIQMSNLVQRGISMGYGNAYGCIDHCYMISAPTGNPQFIDYQGYGDATYGSWTNANPLGTTNVQCVEDCVFDNTPNGTGNGFFDAYNGAQLVFRHNTCIGYAPSGCHGFDSGDISCRTWEIYNNIFTNYPINTSCLQMRGGTGCCFSNTFYGGGNNTFFYLDYYRSCFANHSFIASDGQPGKGMDVNFANSPVNSAPSFNGQPANNSTLVICFSTYTFKSSYTDGGNNVYGGGNVVIGSDVAHTITNLMNCINLGPGAGTTYAASATLGFGFSAIACTATDLILTNQLDGNTDAFGYPANMQFGVIKSFPRTATNFVNNQVLFPIYQWSNVVNGSLYTDIILHDNEVACNYYITNLVKVGRDYSNAIPAANLYSPLVYPHPLNFLDTVVVASRAGPGRPRKGR